MCETLEAHAGAQQCALAAAGPEGYRALRSAVATCGRPIRIRAAISERPSRSTPRSRNFGGWVTGRKRYQTAERGVLPHFELTSDDRIKVNPLAYFGDADVNAYKRRHGLPEHPLFAKGYKSIGCAPCTTIVAEGKTRAPAAGADSTRKNAASISTSMEQSQSRWPQWKRPCSRTAPSSPTRSAPGPRAMTRQACATPIFRSACSSKTATRCWPIRIPTGCWCGRATGGGRGRRSRAVCLDRHQLSRVHRRAGLFERAASGRAATAISGEVRAVGDVLMDQVPLMRRCGIDGVRRDPSGDAQGAGGRAG